MLSKMEEVVQQQKRHLSMDVLEFQILSCARVYVREQELYHLHDMLDAGIPCSDIAFWNRSGTLCAISMEFMPLVSI